VVHTDEMLLRLLFALELRRGISSAHVEIRMERTAPKLSFGLTGDHQLHRARRVPVSHARRNAPTRGYAAIDRVTPPND
jgi:hypothetical protein